MYAENHFALRTQTAQVPSPSRCQRAAVRPPPRRVPLPDGGAATSAGARVRAGRLLPWLRPPRLLSAGKK